MRVLIMGGTVFLGRAVASEALERGHEVTLFHRGRHNPGLFPEAETLIGDRTRDLSPLAGRSWDAVVDTSGFEPEHARAVAELLGGRIEHYGFVSSGSAYRDWPDRAVDEDSATWDSDVREYGEMKAACERALEAALPGRVLVARAGVIVGPHENIGRLPWWLRRVAQGGRVVAPSPPDAGLQLIDARDLAAWMLDMAEGRRAGTFNAIAPPGSTRWGDLLDACVAATGSDAELVWVPASEVTARVAEPWNELPLWPIPGLAGLYAMSAGRAREAGLRPRPLSETVADTWAWLAAGADLGDWRSEVQASGLDPALERELLALRRH
jgi:2'-hydroxyisoflavone reductase